MLFGFNEKRVFRRSRATFIKGLGSHNAVAKKSNVPKQADPSRLPPYDEDGEGLHVVIETPKGSRNKYAFGKTKEIFALTKVLPAGTAFPYDFGFVPSTRAEESAEYQLVEYSTKYSVHGMSLFRLYSYI